MVQSKLLRLVGISALLSAAVGVGCASGTDVPPPPSGEVGAPHVAALSTYEAGVGTLIEIYGENFRDRDDGRMMVVFRGNYDTVDGSTYPVDEEFEAAPVDAGTLRWGTFGPFRVPFGATGDETGTFYGTVAARFVGDDGRVVEDSQPTEISLEVLPSILVHELQPLTASCGAPAQRLLGGAAYRARVEAIGFEPVSFTYTLSAPSLSGQEVSVRRLATGRFDTVGEHGDFFVPQVPEDVQAYGAIFTIQATAADGRSYFTSFGVGVHRPLEVYYNGNVQIAEIFAPTPVSGCIPGGEAGRNAEYNEAESETRARTYQLNWNESWLRTHTVASSSSSTVGLSETNGVGFATTDGEAFRWNVGGEVGGTIGISKMVSLGVKATFGIGGETSRSVENSANRETGLTASETTTDTESVAETGGASAGEAFSWTVSSTDTVARGFGGHVIAGTQGVFYRQTMRLLRRAALVTYNQCGAAQVVGEVDFTDWTWAPDLALGNQCPPLPASNLPEAECIISPCTGE